MILFKDDATFLRNESQCDEPFMRFLAKVVGVPVYGLAGRIYGE